MDAATVHNIVAPAQGHGTPYTYLAWRSGAALRTMDNHKGCPYTPQSISAIQRINQRIQRTRTRARHAVHLAGMAERGRTPHHGQPQGLPLHPSKYLRHPTHQPENPAHPHKGTARRTPCWHGGAGPHSAPWATTRVAPTPLKVSPPSNVSTRESSARAQGHGTPYTYLAWRSGAAPRTMGNHKGCPYTPQSISAIRRINQRIQRTRIGYGAPCPYLA